MGVISTTGSDQIEFLENNYDGGKVALKAVGGLCHYVPCRNLIALNNVGAIREVEVEEVTAGANEVSGEITYTVADSALYRKLETLPVTQSAIQVGGVTVQRKPDSTTIVVIRSKNSDFTPVSGDTLIRREDRFIAENDVNKFNSSQYAYLKLNSESVSVKLVVEKLDQGLIKKL